MERNVLLLGTGGTIACKQTADGLTPVLSSDDLLSYIPQARSFAKVDTIQLCNEDSTNMTPAYWERIVEAISRCYDRYDGFVICHGTDTMAYTAAALSYMIQNSSKPIVITGAQKPINMDVTDAKTNLSDSILYAADPDSHGVHLVFDGKVIVGTRAKKVRAKSYNAFKSINFPYPAILQDGHIIRYLPSTPYTEPVQFYKHMDPRICVLKMIPGVDGNLLEYAFSQYDCIVVESFGVGGIPASISQAFYRQMTSQTQNPKFVVMATQVENEGSDMAIYQVGKKIKEDLGLWEAYDMTLEATITKMMWILSLYKQGNVSYQEAKRLFYTEIHHDLLFPTYKFSVSPSKS